MPSEDLQAPSHFGSNNNYMRAFDGNNMNKPGDSSTSCYIGAGFDDGYIGYISQVRSFLGTITNKARYSNITQF